MGLLSTKKVVFGVVIALLILIPVVIVLGVLFSNDRLKPKPALFQEHDNMYRVYPDYHVKSDPYKTYLIAIGDDVGALEYRNPKGHLRGFSHELKDLVCNEARINCVAVYTNYSQCWKTDHVPAYGGDGLMSRRYDACIGWFTTRVRMQIFKFAMPFHNSAESYLYHRKDDHTIDGLSFVNKTIGFLSSWAQDPQCFEDEYPVKHRYKNYKQKSYKTVKESVNALKGKEVDALFGPVQVFKKFINNGEIARSYKQRFSCMIAGNGLMTRKDSDFIPKWNTGLQRAIATGKFKALCDEAHAKHGEYGIVDCIET